jgi:Fe-S cluster assembly ATP-binding protein
VTEGTIELNGVNVIEMGPDERARAGLFMAFQRPVAIPGREDGRLPPPCDDQRP